MATQSPALVREPEPWQLTDTELAAMDNAVYPACTLSDRLPEHQLEDQDYHDGDRWAAVRLMLDVGRESVDVHINWEGEADWTQFECCGATHHDSRGEVLREYDASDLPPEVESRLVAAVLAAVGKDVEVAERFEASTAM